MTGKLVQLRPEVRIEDVSDGGLVAACATGDRAARALLFERHVAAVHRFVARMRGADPDTVDDLVQATFVSAFQSAGGFRGERAIGWLYGIAANHVRAYARGEIRRKRALSSVADASQVAWHARPASANPALLARLPGAIAELPHDLRAAFVLVDLEGERGRDAADALGIPEGTLWRRVFHARKTLRDVLGGDA